MTHRSRAGRGPAPTQTRLVPALRDAESRLAAAGIDNARLDGRLLVAAALGLEPDALRLGADRALTADEARRVEAHLSRRLAREPVSRILGRREFWSLDFRVTPAVLDPRPDSETLVEAALALFPERDAPLRILDLGTGSGCLLLAVLHERPGATGLGVDASAAALAVAADNARHLGLAARAAFRGGDWGRGLDERFDLILCNPPYVAEAERATLAPEVARHDPPAALFAGPDGLDAYRALLPDLPRLFAPGGAALFEIGASQAAAVAAIARGAGLAVVSVRADLAGRDRCVILRA
jgi:release factor glutamine methyltransferase